MDYGWSKYSFCRLLKRNDVELASHILQMQGGKKPPWDVKIEQGFSNTLLISKQQKIVCYNISFRKSLLHEVTAKAMFNLPFN